jgi:hypothetical protein
VTLGNSAVVVAIPKSNADYNTTGTRNDQ